MFVTVYRVNHKTSKTRGKFEIFEKLVIKMYLRRKYTGIFSNEVVTVYTGVVTVILRETNTNAEVPLISLFFCKRSINVKREEINKRKKEI